MKLDGQIVQKLERNISGKHRQRHYYFILLDGGAWTWDVTGYGTIENDVRGSRLKQRRMNYTAIIGGHSKGRATNKKGEDILTRGS